MSKRWPALAAIAIVLAASGLAAYAPEAPAVRIVILHTNDLHGRLLPFAYAEAGRGNVERDGVGGAARRATLTRRLKRQAPDSTLLVDAGDVFTRGALTNAYEGLADIAAMNATGYQLAAIGNNEFKARDGVDAADWAGSQKALLKVVGASRFPWLCANLADSSGKPPQGIRPTAVMKVGSLRVGFVGLTAPRSASYPQTRGWKITDPIAAAKVWVRCCIARHQFEIVISQIEDGELRGLKHRLADGGISTGEREEDGDLDGRRGRVCGHSRWCAVGADGDIVLRLGGCAFVPRAASCAAATGSQSEDHQEKGKNGTKAVKDGHAPDTLSHSIKRAVIDEIRHYTKTGKDATGGFA